MKKLFSVIAIAAIAGVAFVSCDKDKDVALEGISISQKSAELIAGDTLFLTASYLPGDASSKPEIVWTTSDSIKAKVVNGVVYAKGYGEFEITASAGGFSDKCTVKIGYAEPVVGESDYAITGTILGSNWGLISLKMIDCSEEDNGTTYYMYCVKNVTLTESDRFKIWKYDHSQEQYTWDFNRGGIFTGLDQWFEVTQDGQNIQPGLTGTYDIWFYLNQNLVGITEHGK